MCSPARKYTHFTSLVTRHLQHQVRGGSEAVQAQALTSPHAAEAVGAVADDPGTEKRSGPFVREIRWQRVCEVFPDYTGFSVASIDVIAREPGLLAEIFGLVSAEVADTIAGIEPGNTDAIAFLQISHAVAARIDNSDDLMSGNDRNLGQREVAFHDVQIGVTNPTAANLDADFRAPRRRCRNLRETEWGIRYRSRGFQQHRLHGLILVG